MVCRFLTYANSARKSVAGTFLEMSFVTECHFKSPSGRKRVFANSLRPAGGFFLLETDWGRKEDGEATATEVGVCSLVLLKKSSKDEGVSTLESVFLTQRLTLDRLPSLTKTK